MAFTRYEQRGSKWYAYEITSFWDKKLKKPRQSSKYLGVAESKGGTYKKSRGSSAKKTEKSILDFGDSYAMSELSKSIGLTGLIKESFGDVDTIMSLMFYQLVEGGAMYNCGDWREGNIAKVLFPEANVSSQRVSDLLKELGEEHFQRKFFTAYIKKFFPKKHGILVDSTSLPSAINADMNAFGHTAAGVQKNVTCLMLVDEESKLPIYFRGVAGDIVDVSTLQTTMHEIHQLGLDTKSVILDAGYFSRENMQYLHDQGLNFVTRMPKSRKSFLQCVKDAGEMESLKNAVRYGKRTIFIKSLKIQLHEREVFAHVVLDQGKKAKDINVLTKDAMDGEMDEAEVEKKLAQCGYFVLISRNPLKREEVLPTYYTRQTIEQIFGFAKSNDLLPLRVHSDQSISGYLMLVFLTLILLITLRQRLDGAFTTNNALLLLRGLKAKIYSDEIIIQEHSKKIRDISKLLNIIMPTFLGI